MLAADDEPPKWTRHYDKHHDYYYYVNELTGESFWEGTEGAPSSNQLSLDENEGKDSNDIEEEEESFLLSNSGTLSPTSSISNNNIYSAHGRTLIDTLADMRNYDKSIQWHAVLMEAPLCFFECWFRVFISLVFALYCSIFWFIAYIYSIYNLSKSNHSNSNSIRLIMKELSLGWLREVPICIATAITLFILPFIARFPYSCFKPSGYGNWYLQPLPTLVGWVDSRRFCTFTYGGGRSATDPDLDLSSYHTSSYNRNRSGSKSSSSNYGIDVLEDELMEEMFENGIPDDEIEEIILIDNQQVSSSPPQSIASREIEVEDSRIPQAQTEDEWIAPPMMEYTLLELLFYFWILAPLVWIFVRIEDRYAHNRTIWIRKMENINNKPICGSNNDSFPGPIAIFPRRLFKIGEILINKRICSKTTASGNRFMKQCMTNERPFVSKSIGIEIGFQREDSGTDGPVCEMRHATFATREKVWDYDYSKFASSISSFINNNNSNNNNNSSSSSSSGNDDGVELRDASFIASPIHQSMNARINDDINDYSNQEGINDDVIRMRHKNNTNNKTYIHSMYSDDDDDDDRDDDEFYEGVGEEDIRLLK